MPSRQGAFGDLYVKFKVDFPDSIEQEQAKVGEV
jgi:DnaJ-class molecular chaperone